MACPFCGLRPLEEFLFRKTVPNAASGSSTGAAAGTDVADGASAYARVYLRIDSAECSIEEWQHVAGCRAWLLVDRNPSTGLVRSVALVGGGQ
jgi:sarcosine oxidase subunit delta